MKILIISTLFPPDILGGAEIAAHHFARWLVRNGHEVTVLATAKNDSQTGWRTDEGIRVFRVLMPRPYPAHGAQRAHLHQKAVWHVRDHCDPANARIVGRILDEVQPDAVNLQILQGIGYNAISEIAARDLPVVFTLHDLGLACIRMSMFSRGRTCEKQCLACRVSTSVKWGHLNRLRRLSFWSPSQAILNRLNRFTPLARYRSRAIKLPLDFIPPRMPREEGNRVRLLYVGRIHPTKGVDFLLRALRRLSASHDFEIMLAGSGSSEAALRAEFQDAGWCRFLGFVPNDKIGDVMNNADLLCVPSLWVENSPLVVYQALSLGLPVLASDAGGLPELVEDGRNGLLVPPGDDTAWSNCLSELFSDPWRLNSLRAYADQNRSAFSCDVLGRRVMDLFLETIDTPSVVCI